MTGRCPVKGIHSRCGAVWNRDGYALVCGKSPEHVRSADPTRRAHYDPSADERWEDQ